MARTMARTTRALVALCAAGALALSACGGDGGGGGGTGGEGAPSAPGELARHQAVREYLRRAFAEWNKGRSSSHRIERVLYDRGRVASVLDPGAHDDATLAALSSELVRIGVIVIAPCTADLPTLKLVRDAYGDASVRTVGFSIDMEIFASLSTHAGGEIPLAYSPEGQPSSRKGAQFLYIDRDTTIWSELPRLIC